MSDSVSSPRSERFAAFAALFVLLGILTVLFSSCGGSDLVLGGTGLATATPVETGVPTETPTL